MPTMNLFSLVFPTIFSLLASNLNAQQKYSGPSALDCQTANRTTQSPDFLYTCNGEKRSCEAFLIFRSRPPFNSVASISNLTSSNPRRLAQINNVSTWDTFPNNTEVIVPVKCSCLNMYYGATSSYATLSDDTYYTIATIIYQGLSTCSILLLENIHGEYDLEPGMKLNVSLRCACPTKKQAQMGTKFLLTYLVEGEDNINSISEKFNVNTSSVVYANEFSDESETIYSVTTILVPLLSQPQINQTIINGPPGVAPTTSPSAKHSRNSKKGIYIGIGIGISSSVFSIFLFTCFWCRKRRKHCGPTWKENKYVVSKDLVNRITNVDQALKVYDFDEIQEATGNFSPENRISSLVYRAVVRGQVLCVKKMGNDVSKEVEILKKINHFNLITLHGALFGASELELSTPNRLGCRERAPVSS